MSAVRDPHLRHSSKTAAANTAVTAASSDVASQTPAIHPPGNQRRWRLAKVVAGYDVVNAQGTLTINTVKADTTRVQKLKMPGNAFDIEFLKASLDFGPASDGTPTEFEAVLSAVAGAIGFVNIFFYAE